MRTKRLAIIGLLIISAIGIPLILSQSQVKQILTGKAWYTSQSATAACNPTSAKVFIKVSFTNQESNKGMLVKAVDSQSGKSVDLGTITAGKTNTGNIDTQLTSLNNGYVTFKLAWTDGSTGTDSRNAGYSNVSQCTPPTPTPKPTEVNTPTPTLLIATPTSIPTSIPTYAPTDIPTYAPTGTPVPTPAGTTITLDSLLDGIGSRGDNTNPEGTLSNKNPLHPERNISINIFNTSNQLIASSTSTMQYSSSSGSFKTTFTITQPITTGSYTIKATTDTHLTRLLPGIQNIKSEQNNELPNATFIAGDIINDNKLDILDYNILIGCYSDLAAATSCNDTQKTTSDLNDDGAVSQFDYNLLLREIAIQPGE